MRRAIEVIAAATLAVFNAFSAGLVIVGPFTLLIPDDLETRYIVQCSACCAAFALLIAGIDTDGRLIARFAETDPRMEYPFTTRLPLAGTITFRAACRLVSVIMAVVISIMWFLVAYFAQVVLGFRSGEALVWSWIFVRAYDLLNSIPDKIVRAIVWLERFCLAKVGGRGHAKSSSDAVILAAIAVVGIVALPIVLTAAPTRKSGIAPVTQVTPLDPDGAVSAVVEMLPTCDVADASVSASSTAPDSTDHTGELVSYSAQNLVDGDTATAWRIDGDGIGGSIMFQFPSECRLSEISVVGGYDKIDSESGEDRWSQNRRVAEFGVSIDDNEPIAWALREDSRTWQKMEIGPVSVTRLTLVITGSAPTVVERDNTAISEVALG